MRKWFIQQSLDHPWRSIIISLIATFLFASGTSYFIIDDDMMKLMPEKLDSRISWEEIQNEFGSTEEIFIAFGKKGSSIFKPENFSALWDLTAAIKEKKEVEEAISLTTMTRMDNVDDFMEISDLQPRKFLSQDEVDGIKFYLDKNPALKKRFVSKNNEYLLATAKPYGNESLDVFRNIIVSTGDSLLSKPGYEVYYGGQAYVNGSMPAMVRNDVSSLMVVGLFIMILILLLNLRSIPGVLMVLMVIALSLISMLGFMGWIYKLTGSNKFLFTMAHTTMPIILLTIANSDGVHVVSKFFKEMRTKKDVRLSVASAMDSLLVPIFLTSITTISAFLIMITSPIEPLIGYGIIISFGISWAWFLSSLLLPAVLSLNKWKVDSKAFTSPSFFEKVVKNLGKVVLNFPKRVFMIGAIFVVLGVFGIFKIIVDVNFRNFFKPGTEIRDSIDFMDQEMTGTNDVRVRIEGDMKDPKILSKMVGLQSYMEKHDKVSISFSIADIVEQMHRTVMNDDVKYEVIPDSRGKVNNLFTMYSMSGDLDDFESLVDYNYEVGLITALSEVMSTDEIFSYASQLKTYIENNFDNSTSLSVTGMIIIFRDLVVMIVRSSAISIIASLIIIGIIVSLFFKRILWGLLAVVPLTSAVIINFGLMGYFGIELSHITAILSSIIIGVGVDFAIHYISQFRRISRKVDEDKISREVVEDVGYPIILDAASNMGFGALLFSTFAPIQYIGGLMVFAMVSTSLGTLTILSALSEMMKKRLSESSN